MGGQHMLDKEGSAVPVQQILEAGGALALLADQHAGPKGCWANFLGHKASCHKALALFVLTSGAEMVVSYNRRLDRPLKFEMGCTGLPHQINPVNIYRPSASAYHLVTTNVSKRPFAWPLSSIGGCIVAGANLRKRRSRLQRRLEL